MAQIEQRVEPLTEELQGFDRQVRDQALEGLLFLAGDGVVPVEPEAEVANVQCHSSFPYNAYGHSPSSLAWLAKRRAFKLMGIVDFDVLDTGTEDRARAKSAAAGPSRRRWARR